MRFVFIWNIKEKGSNFKLGTIYTNTPLRVGFLWMMPFRVQNLTVCGTPFRGQFGGMCTRVGSTFVWEWAPRGGILLKSSGVRGIFFRGSNLTCSQFFQAWNMSFPSRIFHFGRPQTNLSIFKKWKKDRKKILCSFSDFSPFNFKFSTFPVTISFFSCPFCPPPQLLCHC